VREPSLRRNKPDGAQVEPVDRFAELVECRYPLGRGISNPIMRCARLDAIFLGAAQEEIGDDGAGSRMRFAAHTGRLAVIRRPRRRPPPRKFCFQGAPRERIEIIVDHVGAHRN